MHTVQHREKKITFWSEKVIILWAHADVLKYLLYKAVSIFSANRVSYGPVQCEATVRGYTGQRHRLSRELRIQCPHSPLEHIYLEYKTNTSKNPKDREIRT